METHLMTLVRAKKKALTLKKSTKSTPAHQKKVRHRKKGTKKHYGALKSTHYDPCDLLAILDLGQGSWGGLLD